MTPDPASGRNGTLMSNLPQVTVIGAGRLGHALAATLRAAGVIVRGPHPRGATGTESQIVVLCVPDGEIARAATGVTPGRLVGHCSGATTLAPLAPHEAFSLHPLMTVTGPDTAFAGAGCAVAGSTPRALATAHELARHLGMQPFTIPDDDRAAYHAAACVASNFLVTVLDLADRLAGTAGIERSALEPIVRTAVDNWIRTGPAALTGPIARGDHGTVQRQRQALADRLPADLPLFEALVTATETLAHR